MYTNNYFPRTDYSLNLLPMAWMHMIVHTIIQYMYIAGFYQKLTYIIHTVNTNRETHTHIRIMQYMYIAVYQKLSFWRGSGRVLFFLPNRVGTTGSQCIVKSYRTIVT